MRTIEHMRSVGEQLAALLPPPRPQPQIAGHVVLANGVTVRANDAAGEIRGKARGA